MRGSPRTECARRTTLYISGANKQRVIPIEWSWWVAPNNACEPGEQLIVRADGDDESDLVGWSLLLLAATVRSFAHMALGLSHRITVASKERILILFSAWKTKSTKIHTSPVWKQFVKFRQLFYPKNKGHGRHLKQFSAASFRWRTEASNF